MRTAVTHSRFWVLAVLLALGMAACDTELVDVEPPLESPILTALEPAEAVAGDDTFTLSVEGGNFTVATTVYWNGEALPTEFVSDSLVRAQVGAEDLEAAGAVTVEVVDPSSSLISNQLLFEVLEPAVTGLVVTAAPHPLARYLDVTLNRSDSIEVRYRRDDGIGPTLAIRALVDRTGRVTLARLAPDADYASSFADQNPLEKIAVATTDVEMVLSGWHVSFRVHRPQVPGDPQRQLLQRVGRGIISERGRKLSLHLPIKDANHFWSVRFCQLAKSNRTPP